MSKWQSFQSAMCEKFPGTFANLNSPVNQESIKRLEERVDAVLSKDFYSLYESCNGEKENSPGVIFGLTLLSIDEILSEMDVWDGIIDDGLEDLNDSCKSTPKNAIKPVYANKKWIPILSDGGGNFIGLDYDPDAKGKVGQVINFGRDEEAKRVISKSLGALFTLMEGVGNRDDIVIEDNGSLSVNNMHFIDVLKNAKKLDQIFAKQKPGYGIFSIWAYPGNKNELPENYFTSSKSGDELSFYDDFGIDFNDDVSSETSMNMDGSPSSVTDQIKFATYSNKYADKLLAAANAKGVTDAGAIHMLKDFDYQLSDNKIETKNNVVFLGSFKVY